MVATLKRSDDQVVVGEGANLADARRIVRDKAPDMLVLEIAIPT